MECKQYPAYLTQENYRELITRYEPEQRAAWCYMRPISRPCCTPELLSELDHFHRNIEQSVRRDAEQSKRDGLRFLVIASKIPGVFNLGGDLALFLKLIHAGNRDGLFRYAKSCIDLLYVGYNLPITTISLVQGDAFGGGFEGALSSRVLVAERRAQMGLPEILFNLFPGMGAYSLLARKLDPARAERLILSGRMYSAEELYSMGVVDVLAENDHGEEAVYAYMRKHNRTSNGYDAIHKVRQIYHPISYDELIRIATIWVETALQLRERDLRVMKRIASTQEKLTVLRPSAEVMQLA
ncbi:MAG: crotonase/enoyl-CoA hydratase family protein [Sulfuricaulis sp.]